MLLLKVTFLGKISQFEFLVMSYKNIFAWLLTPLPPAEKGRGGRGLYTMIHEQINHFLTSSDFYTISEYFKNL